jgi:hypothetical protein
VQGNEDPRSDDLATTSGYLVSQLAECQTDSLLDSATSYGARLCGAHVPRIVNVVVSAAGANVAELIKHHESATSRITTLTRVKILADHYDAVRQATRSQPSDVRLSPVSRPITPESHPATPFPCVAPPSLDAWSHFHAQSETLIDKYEHVRRNIFDTILHLCLPSSECGESSCDDWLKLDISTLPNDGRGAALTAIVAGLQVEFLAIPHPS